MFDPEECRRFAANCRGLAKIAPTSIEAAKFEELANSWLRVAQALEDVGAAVRRLRDREKKTG
jgi:hypothetical protein